MNWIVYKKYKLDKIFVYIYILLKIVFLKFIFLLKKGRRMKILYWYKNKVIKFILFLIFN